MSDNSFNRAEKATRSSSFNLATIQSSRIEDLPVVGTGFLTYDIVANEALLSKSHAMAVR